MRRRMESQSVIFRGITASGKSASSQLLVNQILRLSSHSKKEARLADQVKALSTLLDSFGNAKTLVNPNASRHSRYLELHFSERGRIQAAKVLTFGLDKSRLSRLSFEERTYHVFYQFLAGATPEERDRRWSALCSLCRERDDPIGGIPHRRRGRRESVSTVPRASPENRQTNIHGLCEAHTHEDKQNVPFRSYLRVVQQAGRTSHRRSNQKLESEYILVNYNGRLLSHKAPASPSFARRESFSFRPPPGPGAYPRTLPDGLGIMFLSSWELLEKHMDERLGFRRIWTGPADPLTRCLCAPPRDSAFSVCVLSHSWALDLVNNT
ncbi:hypothetical protein NUW54_g11331 [Trametes sanguinea]|uniref:Uncharacterized protein n=1 Tax=Trametes sanguinea TaxID=158606 RepID=A0ACC1NI78_9APHY|nr:hypothetical protein NUW54_g11331 [Trametes sanguinea]